jgi:two-component sensor histidine kinase
MQRKRTETSGGREPIIKNIYVRWATIFGIWLLLAAFFAAVGSLGGEGTGERPKQTDYLFQMTIFWLVWATFSIPVLRFARHFHFDHGQIWRSLPAHIGLFAVIAPLHLATYNSVKHALGPALGFTVMPWPEGRAFFAESIVNVFVYVLVVAIYNAFAYYHMYHREKSAISDLEARLAAAELSALKMQLQPHFLFNTLNAISVLMTEDVEKANQMLVRLSELLRLTLESSGHQQVSLKQELDFLERYLGIERIRFSDRLDVHLDVEPETLDARVPNLILQPLVENAIRHGIAPRAEGGRLDVRARRRNGKLELTVHDDGPGMAPGHAATDSSNGIGLANCRARLTQLYGDDHGFEYGRLPDGGFSVVLTLPFLTQP